MSAQDMSRPPGGAAGPQAAGSGRPGWQRAVWVVAMAAVAGYCWFAGGTRPFQAAALVCVAVPVLLLGIVALLRPPERIPAPQRLSPTGLSYWLICVAVLFEWEASSFRDGSPWWHPSLTDLVNPLIGPHPLRSAAFAIWLAAGWGLVRR